MCETFSGLRFTVFKIGFYRPIYRVIDELLIRQFLFNRQIS